MRTEPRTVIGYIRVSTDEQAASGAGLAAQRTAIAAECQRRGWQLVDVVVDAGASGRTLTGRPALAAALDRLDRREADALVVAKLDRLSRSVVDSAGLLDRAGRRGWGLVALDLGVDTTTPAGEAMANVMATFAQLERRMIGERTRVALAARRSAGVVLGRPPVVPEPVVARVLAERAAGRSLRAIADGLTADGVPTARGGQRWQPTSVRKLLASQVAARLAA